MRRLVVITGPEGVGKSTQITILMYRLAKHGYDIDYGYIRSGSFLVRVIKKILVQLGRYEETVTELGDKIRDADHLIVSRLINLFMVIDFLTALLKSLYHLLVISLSRKNMIIYERYSNDLVLDYYYASIFYNIDKRTRRITYRVLSAISRRIEPLIIILDADTKTLLQRQASRKRSDLLVFVLVQKSLQKILASTFTTDKCLSYIDTTNRSIIDTNKVIYQLIVKGC